MILTVCVLTFSACSKTETEEPVTIDDQAQAYEQLFADLTALNVEMFGQEKLPEEYIDTRARMRWWKWLTIVAVDAGATLISGDLSTGIAASTLGWNTLKDTEGSTSKNPDIKPSSISLNYVKASDLRYTTDIDMGYLHNEIISFL